MAQIGLSSLGTTGNLSCSTSGFLYPWRPPCPGVSFGSKTGKRNVGVLGFAAQALAKEESNNRSVGGVIVEELQFVPSFDEYLKAMESVKTDRDKKIPSTSSGIPLKDDSRRSKGISSHEFMSPVAQNVALDEMGGATVREDVADCQLDGQEGRVSISQGNLGSIGSGANANLKRRMIRGGRRFNNQTSRMNPEMQEFNGGSSESNRKRQGSGGVIGGLKTRASSMGSHSRQRLEEKGRKSERVEVDVTGNRITGRLMRNDNEVSTNAPKGIFHKARRVSRNDQAFVDTTDDGDLQEERTAFKSFEDFSGKPRPSKRETEDRIQKLASWLNGADIDMPEWMFSKAMRSAKIKYTDHSILRVIQLLGKLGNWKRVLQVIEWLQLRERYKAYRLRNVYTTALNVLGKARRPVEALNLFHVMQEQTSLYPDIVAYHSIAVTLGQAGHMRELFDVIDSMQSLPKKLKSGSFGKWDPRLKPDVVVYNAVLNACVRRKQCEGAFWVLQQLKQQGQQPSCTTYGLIMEVMLVCGKYNLVHEFFRKLQKSSIPNALVYRVLVNTYWKEGKPDDAVSTVREMERRGIVGSAAIYYDLARCLCSSGRCQEGLMQIEKICKVANKPLVVTYTGIIQACIDSGNIQNALYIFDQMKHFCSPNLVTCNIMLKAFLDHGLFGKANDLFHKMSEDGNHISCTTDYGVRVLPDIYTFNTMLDACTAEKRWDDFEYIYGRMLHNGYHFNTKRHLRMILDASRAGKGEALERTWKHLVQTDRAPPFSLVKERFCMMLEKDNIESALGCITTNLTTESEALSKTVWLNLLNKNAHRFRKDTLMQLMQKVSNLISGWSSPNPVLQNLLTSCGDFLRTQVQVPETNLTETLCR